MLAEHLGEREGHADMKKVLVIDDDEQMRAMIQVMLEREGYSVETAENGKVGLDKFGAEAYDLVITDIIMPEKEGLEIISEMHERDPSIRIIAMSGGLPGYTADFLPVAKFFGAVRTFEKPIIASEFTTAVRELLTVA